MIINLLFFVSFLATILLYNLVEEKKTKEYLKIWLLVIIIMFLW